MGALTECLRNLRKFEYEGPELPVVIFPNLRSPAIRECRLTPAMPHRSRPRVNRASIRFAG